jgi:hypothetical protein
MRRLYCETDGRFNDAVAWVTGVFHPPYVIQRSSGPTARISDGELGIIARELNDKGYYIFADRLSASLCDELVSFALSTPAYALLASPSQAFCQEYTRIPVRYDRQAATSAKYNLPGQAIAGSPAVQRLLGDETILSVAQTYLCARPVIDLIAMWWSTPFLGRPSSEAAQLFHFDMDRIKFLKFFFYLTEVGPRNGPHVYISRSHRRKPAALRRDGRIADDELMQYYKPIDVVEITGRKGTMFVADTRGFHKGKHPEDGDRLLLQIEFATDLFGQNYPRYHIRAHASPSLATKAQTYRRTFSNFVFDAEIPQGSGRYLIG